MKETPYDLFLQSTVGRFTITGSSFVWCASPTLCGAFLWGEQTEAETRAILHVFDQRALQMSSTFDIVLDTRGVGHVDPSGLKLLFQWLMKNRRDLAARIRLQASVIREGPIGFLLTGLLPVAGRTHPYRIFTEPIEAFRAVVGERGDVLCAEVEAIAEGIRGVARELRATREMLQVRLDASLNEVGRALGMSSRSLQRVLTRHGTSFHREVMAARFERAQELLRSGEHKIDDVGARVGISDRALTLLFREKTGLTPAEWRKQHRRA